MHRPPVMPRAQASVCENRRILLMSDKRDKSDLAWTTLKGEWGTQCSGLRSSVVSLGLEVSWFRPALSGAGKKTDGRHGSLC